MIKTEIRVREAFEVVTLCTLKIKKELKVEDCRWT